MNVDFKKISKLNPCYNLSDIGMQEDYADETLLEAINTWRDKVKSPQDILWFSLREDYFTAKELRHFGCWCARRSLQVNTTPDSKTVNAIEVSEKYADGLATESELIEAKNSASRATASAKRSLDALIQYASNPLSGVDKSMELVSKATAVWESCTAAEKCADIRPRNSSYISSQATIKALSSVYSEADGKESQNREGNAHLDELIRILQKGDTQ